MSINTLELIYHENEDGYIVVDFSIIDTYLSEEMKKRLCLVKKIYEELDEYRLKKAREKYGSSWVDRQYNKQKINVENMAYILKLRYNTNYRYYMAMENVYEYYNKKETRRICNGHPVSIINEIETIIDNIYDPEESYPENGIYKLVGRSGLGF